MPSSESTYENARVEIQANPEADSETTYAIVSDLPAFQPTHFHGHIKKTTYTVYIVVYDILLT